MYRMYMEIMSKTEGCERADMLYYNMRIIQVVFENNISLRELESMDIVELMTTVKTIHFVMQEIITPKFQTLQGGQQIIIEESAFDDYDMENGYETEDDRNIYEICLENTDMIVKTAIRVLNNSYSQCMKADITDLIRYIKYEIDSMNDK